MNFEYMQPGPSPRIAVHGTSGWALGAFSGAWSARNKVSGHLGLTGLAFSLKKGEPVPSP